MLGGFPLPSPGTAAEAGTCYWWARFDPTLNGHKKKASGGGAMLGFEVDLGSHGEVLSITQRSSRVAGAIYAASFASILGGSCHISDAKTSKWGG